MIIDNSGNIYVLKTLQLGTRSMTKHGGGGGVKNSVAVLKNVLRHQDLWSSTSCWLASTSHGIHDRRVLKI
jgi:hypothetical protein